MSKKRTRRYVGEIERVFCYHGPNLPPEHMMAVADIPKGRGQFFFDGIAVFFHEDDAKLQKEIIYRSYEQVQRTTRGKTSVRLRP